jgi:hypothetical protein
MSENVLIREIIDPKYRNESFRNCEIVQRDNAIANGGNRKSEFLWWFS